MRSASSGCGQGVASTEGLGSSARNLVASSSSSMCSTSTERFGFGKRFRFVSMECVGGVLVSYFGDYFSERFDTW